jgi:putative glycosyltransferase (TIGR04372 family)
MKNIKKFILVFMYDIVFIQNNRTIFYIFKFLFIPSWIYYRFINNKQLKVFFLKTNIFGIQIVDFQQFHHLASGSSEIFYFNYHPQIAGPFLFEKQIDQIMNLPNVKIVRHVITIQRAFAQSLENSIAIRMRSKSKVILQSLRAFGFNSSLLKHNQCLRFPVFSSVELDEHRNYLHSKVSRIDKDKEIIALHSRTGNFPKFKEPSRVSSDFRNTSFKEIHKASKYFDTSRFSFIRIGHFERTENEKSPVIIDIRQNILADNALQLSAFASVSAYFGSSSGPMGFFASQKKPCLLLSTYPIDIEYPSDPRFFIVIPKIILDCMNNRPLTLNEQFKIDLIKIQNLYNDKELIELNLKVECIPQKLISQIYLNWQNSVLIGKETEWLTESIKASKKLFLEVGRLNFPILPIEYIVYVNNLTK